MARCWKGEYLEAKFLVKLDELRGGRHLAFTQDAAYCTATLLRGHLWRQTRGSELGKGRRPSDLLSPESVPA